MTTESKQAETMNYLFGTQCPYTEERPLLCQKREGCNNCMIYLARKRDIAEFLLELILKGFDHERVISELERGA